MWRCRWFSEWGASPCEDRIKKKKEQNWIESLYFSPIIIIFLFTASSQMLPLVNWIQQISVSFEGKGHLTVCISHVHEMEVQQNSVYWSPSMGVRNWLVGHLVLVSHRTPIHMLHCSKNTLSIASKPCSWVTHWVCGFHKPIHYRSVTRLMNEVRDGEEIDGDR